MNESVLATLTNNDHDHDDMTDNHIETFLESGSGDILTLVRDTALGINNDCLPGLDMGYRQKSEILQLSQGLSESQRH